MTKKLIIDKITTWAESQSLEKLLVAYRMLKKLR